MALLDLLGRRWALRVIWELRGQRLTFRELQATCGGISSSVLNDRLSELRAAGIVESGDTGYGLTTEGRRLLEMFSPVEAWADGMVIPREDEHQSWAEREQNAKAR